MNEHDTALSIIYAAIDEVNALLPEKQQLQKSGDTELYGPSGILDSLGLINFIVAVEEQMHKKYGKQYSLGDLSYTSEGVNPFSSVGALSNYMVFLLQEKNER